MLRLLLTIALLTAASSALAQTTTFTTDCNGLVTVAGSGLVLSPTSTAASEHLCRATTPQYAGKAYFEFTNTGNATSAVSVGLTNKGPITPVYGGFDISTTTQSPGQWIYNGGVIANINTGGQASIDWSSGYVTPLGSLGVYTLGKTVGIAVNLDSDSPEMWMTLDVTGTSGFGGGPLWNNNVVNSPTVPGTGKAFFLPGYGAYPTYRSNAAAGTNVTTTFNFGATSFVGTAPSGYTSWEATAQSDPNPGPTHDQNVQIANAPGWASGASYVLKNRVLAGAGWSGSAFTIAQPVCLFAVTVAGTAGSDPTAFNTACASGTPAAVGGGLDGSIPAAWASATSVTDGGVTWKLLTRVDYATLTGWLNDDTLTWTASTLYRGGQYVTNAAGYAYKLDVGGGQQPSCTSGSTPLTGTTKDTSYSDGNCTWTNRGQLTYSSKANIWPHSIYPSNEAILQFNWVVNAYVWYGGSARKVYQPGQNGENEPLLVWEHMDFGGDLSPRCWRNTPFVGGVNTQHDGGCAAGFSTAVYNASLSAAPGDSFADNIVPATGPIADDDTKGVALYSNTAWNPSPCGAQCTTGEPIALSDTGISLKRLQIKSEHGAALPADFTGGPGYQHTNNVALIGNIIDCGASGTVCIAVDGGNKIVNNSIIARSTVTGSAAILTQYATTVTNNTIIGANATNGTAIVFSSDFFAVRYNAYNNLFFGFPNPLAYRTSGGLPALSGANNATDVSGAFSGGTFTLAVSGASYTSAMLAGVNTSSGCGAGLTSPCSGLTASNVLMGPTVAAPDLRVKATTAANYGAGATYDVGIAQNATTGCGPCPSTQVQYDGVPPPLDVLSTARPLTGRYDIGAVQFIPGTPAPSSGTGVGRRWGR